jgi:uncharacterized protein YndB with AHSA1/START domain
MAPETDTLADDELLIERVFDVPRALVWRIWAQREHMIRWLGPTAFTCTHLEMDFRPGGKWRACIVSDEYGENWMGGEYREIEPERRIVYSFAWDADSGEPVETLIAVEFEDRGEGGTRQRFHQTPFLSVESRDSHIGGWSECFDRETAYVERLAREMQA